MILAAAAGDLERAEPVAEARRSAPAASPLEAEQQRAAKGVAAAGRIDDLASPRRPGRGVFSPCCQTSQPSRAERDDDAAQVRARHRLDRAAGALGEHLRLVVVDRDPGGAARRMRAARAPSNIGRPWPGSKMNGMPAAANCARVLEHRVAAVGRDDRRADVGARRHRRLVRPLHRAGMERGDLVVVAVGDDDGLRRVGCRRPRGRARCVDAPASAAAPGSRRRRLPTAATTHRLAAERGEVVGDVAGAAAELAPQRRHQERHVQDVQLVRAGSGRRSGRRRW